MAVQSVHHFPGHAVSVACHRASGKPRMVDSCFTVWIHGEFTASLRSEWRSWRSIEIEAAAFLFFFCFCLFIWRSVCHGSCIDCEKEMPFVGTLPQIFLSSQYLHYFVSVAEKVCRTQEIFSFWSCCYRGENAAICLPILPLWLKLGWMDCSLKSTSAKKKCFSGLCWESILDIWLRGASPRLVWQKRRRMLNLCILPHLFMLL